MPRSSRHCRRCNGSSIQQRNLLAALTGGFPSQEVAEQFSFASLRLPREVPVSLPSQLIEQRPDMRAAEANLHSASARSASRSQTGCPISRSRRTPAAPPSTCSKLLSPETGFWTIAGSVAQPIFHGGALLHAEFAARATYDQAAAQYRSTVIVAFPERRRFPDRDQDRCHRAAEGRRRRACRGTQPHHHTSAIAARRHQLSRLAQRAADLSAGPDQLWCRRRRIATPTRPRSFRRSVAAGGTATTSSRTAIIRISEHLPLIGVVVSTTARHWALSFLRCSVPETASIPSSRSIRSIL